jgi:hypothetical protein
MKVVLLRSGIDSTTRRQLLGSGFPLNERLGSSKVGREKTKFYILHKRVTGGEGHIKCHWHVTTRELEEDGWM